MEMNEFRCGRCIIEHPRMNQYSRAWSEMEEWEEPTDRGYELQFLPSVLFRRPNHGAMTQYALTIHWIC